LGTIFFNSRIKTNKCTSVKCVFIPYYFHQRVSTAVAIILRATYKNIRNPNGLLKYLSEPLDVTKNASYFLHSHWISACLLLHFDAIHFLWKHIKLAVLFYMVKVRPVFSIEMCVTRSFLVTYRSLDTCTCTENIGCTFII
jgi:hypothetical protein